MKRNQRPYSPIGIPLSCRGGTQPAEDGPDSRCCRCPAMDDF
ncbi:hypothetical protein CLOLEP_03956 [[Clostridium] leptum DSM 753]|uniref:Uncharacterized protein n=1 Tax=[Clostridium] leptum DSM 753 TaxID=428125 RepID=A7VZC7_9FIRM|nr:hypothetical protein CLOLEP_03956 [[Clostridium] leptum DSM 753]